MLGVRRIPAMLRMGGMAGKGNGASDRFSNMVVLYTPVTRSIIGQPLLTEMNKQ